MEDPEPFIEWLRGQGLPDEHLAAYRHYVAELAKYPSLSAALRAAEEAGTPARQIANLRQTAARLAEFEAAASPAPAPEILPRRSSGPALEPKPARTIAPNPAAVLGDVAKARRGCHCGKRYDLYLDNDFGTLAKLLGGGIGVGMIVVIRMFGLFGALALALGLAGMGGLVTVFSICLRCEGCRYRISDLDDDEREWIRRGRGRVILVTFALFAGAALCGFLWWKVPMI